MIATGRSLASCALLGTLCLLAWTRPGRTQTAAARRSGAEPVLAIKADRIDTVADGVIENGILLIRGTKIAEIGTDVKIPRTARIIDAGDGTLFPGLVSPACTIGVSDPPRGGPTSHPHYRIADEFYPHQYEYTRALQAGFTTLGLMPRGPGISGRGAVIKPVGESRAEMLVVEAGVLGIAFHADSKGQDVLKKALESTKNKKDSDDPELASLLEAVGGKVPAFITCTRPADTVHLLPLLAGYDKLRPVLVVGPENYRIADRLARHKLPVIVAARIDFEEFTRNRLNVPDLLAEAGVKIACVPVSSDIEGHEDFRRQMAELVKCGLDAETARKAMTLHPAEALGLDYRVGSLEKGKDANLLILDGEILNVGTAIRKVIVEGKVVYENPGEKTP
jgi:hypothetical protein